MSLLETPSYVYTSLLTQQDVHIDALDLPWSESGTYIVEYKSAFTTSDSSTDLTSSFIKTATFTVVVTEVLCESPLPDDWTEPQVYLIQEPPVPQTFFFTFSTALMACNTVDVTFFGPAAVAVQDF